MVGICCRECLRGPALVRISDIDQVGISTNLDGFVSVLDVAKGMMTGINDVRPVLLMPCGSLQRAKSNGRGLA